MQIVLTAIVPVLLLMGLGLYLRHKTLPSRQFWAGLDHLVYFIFTPALFVSTISQTPLDAMPIGGLALSVVIPITVAALLIVLLRKPLRASGPELGSAIQGTIRINTYIGLIVANSLAGTEGMGMFSIACAIVVPLVNIFSVVGFTLYGEGNGGVRLTTTLLRILGNPMILGCLIGITLSLAPFGLPDFASATLELLANGALVTGALSVGAALRWQFNARQSGIVAVVSVFKLVLLPLAAAWIGISVGLTAMPLLIAILATATPPAPSSYVLAQKMGGDSTLMASITGVQTVIAMVMLPVLLTVFENL